MSGFFGKLFGFDEEEEEIPDETFSSNGDKLVEIDLNNPIPYHRFQTLRLIRLNLINEIRFDCR